MPEKLETINEYLRTQFGIDTDDAEPMFRVVWSEDQTEKRETKFTDTGVELLFPEVRELPKYGGWIKDSFILERRVLVPDASLKELAGLKKSYEPVWVFIGGNGLPVPPTIDGCKFVIDCLYAAMGKSSMAKYKDPNIGNTAEETYEINKARVDKIYQELSGEESGLGTETHNASGSAIIMPQNYERDKKVH